MTETSNREQRREVGSRQVRKGQCASVLVAPDHTGADNYHVCVAGMSHHRGNHNSSGGYVWNSDKEILYNPHNE